MANQITGNRYNLNDAIIRQTEKLNKTGVSQEKQKVNLNEGSSFQELLNQQIEHRISFTKHANQRTEERNIVISPSDMSRLENACDRASEKGIKDALIVMDDSAFIVNAPSKKVITVVDKNEMKSNVFTNIDGAVFI